MNEQYEMGWNDLIGNASMKSDRLGFVTEILNSIDTLPQLVRGSDNLYFTNYSIGVREACEAIIAGKSVTYKGPVWVVEDLQAKCPLFCSSRVTMKLENTPMNPTPKQAYDYALYVLKGRWPEAEQVIMQDPQWACEYACNVLKGRWPEAEPTIKKDPPMGL